MLLPAFAVVTRHDHFSDDDVVAISCNASLVVGYDWEHKNNKTACSPE